LQKRGREAEALEEKARSEVMELLPDKIKSTLPPLYSQEHVEDPIVHVKYFTPDSSWTWYATEGSGRRW
jgi:hypothetical protein